MDWPETLPGRCHSSALARACGVHAAHACFGQSDVKGPLTTPLDETRQLHHAGRFEFTEFFFEPLLVADQPPQLRDGGGIASDCTGGDQPAEDFRVSFYCGDARLSDAFEASLFGDGLDAALANAKRGRAEGAAAEDERGDGEGSKSSGDKDGVGLDIADNPGGLNSLSDERGEDSKHR